MTKTELLMAGVVLVALAYTIGNRRGYVSGTADQASTGSGLGNWLPNWSAI